MIMKNVWIPLVVRVFKSCLIKNELSLATITSIPSGITKSAFNWSISSFASSATSMMFPPVVLYTETEIAFRTSSPASAIRDIEVCLSVLSKTVAMSSNSRSGVITIFPSSSTCVIRPSNLIEYVEVSMFTAPAGRLKFENLMMLLTSRMVMPRFSSFAWSRMILISFSTWPAIGALRTPDMPSSSDLTVSATSLRSSGEMSEMSEKVIIGKSENEISITSGPITSAGRSGFAWSTAFCRSLIASEISTSASNSTVMIDELNPELEFSLLISERPAIFVSSGLVRSSSTSVGVAPGSVVATTAIGIFTSG